MTLDEQDRENLVRIKVEKAREALNDAAFLLSDNRLSAAVNRIYYAAFHMLSALALKNGFITSKHRQIIGWFNKEFVKQGKASAQAGKFIHNAYDKRSLGDYDDFIRIFFRSYYALETGTPFLRLVFPEPFCRWRFNAN